MLLSRSRSTAARQALKAHLAVQRLEDRCLLSVQAVSLTNPALYATGAIGGTGAEGHSLSADGRYALFSGGDNIIAGDQNQASDVFVRDLQTGAVTLVSVTPAGTSGNADSYPYSITPDGRFVLFSSSATDLVPGVNNGQSNLFVRDLVAGTTTLVNINSSGTGSSSGGAFSASITPDGRYVAFVSYARDLVSGDTSYGMEIYRRDLVNDTTVLVSTGQGSSQATYVATSGPQITDDGRYIVFQSAQTYSYATRNIFVRDVQAGTTALVSVNSAGTGGGNYDSSNAVIASGGRYVAFVSLANNLIAGVTPSSFQVYLRDLQTGTTRLVTVDAQGGLPSGTSGVDGWGHTETPSISADGRYVAFSSDATDLTGSVPPITPNVYVRDMTAGQTTQVSVTSTGAQPNWYSEHPVMSSDAQTIAFYSYATNLTSQSDTPNGEDLFVRNLTAGTTTLIDVTTTNTTANSQPSAPSLSADGRYVLYNSASDALVAGDNDRTWDVFARDLGSGTTTLVTSRDPNLPSLTGNGSSYLPTASSHANALSADGRYVVFTSDATNLVPGDTNNQLDVFVGDQATGTVTLVSVNAAGTGSGNSFSQRPAISADGRYVAFDSLASNLTNIPDSNQNSDIFVRDLQTGTTTLVTINGAGTAAGDGGSTDAVLSPDGRYVAFRSVDTNLLPNRSLPSAYYNIYLRDLQTGTITLISASADGSGGGNSHSSNPVFTADGSHLVFESMASNLVPNDTNGQMDVFAWDLATGTLSLVSINQAGTASGNGASQNPVLSADGRYVAFESTAPDLVAGDTNNASDVFVRDLQTGTTTLVSINAAGTDSGAGGSQNAALSADGRYVAFESTAPDLVATDSNGQSDVFVRDLQTGTTTLVSINAAGTDSGNYDSHSPVLSSDGRTILFSSKAGNLVASDGNGAGTARTNAFLRNLDTGTTTILDNHSSRGYLMDPEFALTPDGHHVAFTATGDDLTAGDYNDNQDTFVWSTAAPVANPGGPYSVAEGGSLTLDGTGSSDAGNTITKYEWDYDYDGVTFQADAVGSAPTFSAAALDGPTTRTIALRVTDQAGATSLGATTVTVTNVPPTAAATGPASAVRGQAQNFVFSAQDPSAADQAAPFSYGIDWGDGTMTNASRTGNLAAEHVYAAAGSYTVRAWATDKDGGQSDAVTASITIVPAALQNGDLIVGGTTAVDTITLAPADQSGNIKVTINRVVVGTFQPTGQIVVYAQAGNDKVLVQSKKINTTVVYVTVPAVLFGGDGNDTLNVAGDTASNVLVGGAGNDILTGGRGRDILIGGLGADTLRGAGAQDILIGATSDHDDDLAALVALRAEWSRTDLSYQQRIDDLDGTTTSGLNGTYLFNTRTVHDDAATDLFYGGADTDWFFAQLGGSFPDTLADRRVTEVVTALS